MKHLQLIIGFLCLMILIPLDCSSQNDKTKDKFKAVNKTPPPKPPKDILLQDSLAKEIYNLQRELRKAKINSFISKVEASCADQTKNQSIQFTLDEQSGDLIRYTINQKNATLECIENQLRQIQRNFGSMSYGFNNAFRWKPQSRFEISK